jgi:integrase
MATGITKRHSRRCRTRDGGRCSCEPSYEAAVYSTRDGKKIRKAFPREAEAKSWRADALLALERGALRAPSKTTLREAGDVWLAGAESGEIRNRSGHVYKPATLRGYRQALADRIYPEIGGSKLSAITTADLQALVDRWQSEGQRASTIRNTVKPLQAIYRRARSRGGLPVNPTHDLELPSPRPKEVEIVAPDVAAQLLEAVPVEDRATWATALYAGLRYGELRALRWEAVNIAEGRIEVRESWDPRTGPIQPKTRTSRRTVPMPGLLRDLLVDHRMRCREPGQRALVFGQSEDEPFHAATLYRRADKAWKNAELAERLRFHQARHTYASFMIAANVNAKALSAFMGHSSIKVTFDLYGHLMPGSEAEAAALLDAYLSAERERAEDRARAAGEGLTGAQTGAQVVRGG